MFGCILILPVVYLINVRKFVRVRKNVRNMINVKFYLDKADKSTYYPIHLVLRQKGVNIKVATGEKVLKNDWDNVNQQVKESDFRYKSINKFLSFLKLEVEKYFETAPHSHFTDKKVKEMIASLVSSRKFNTDITMVCEDDIQYQNKNKNYICRFICWSRWI
jgi:DNA (cytosine-5)-methyltransferase 1